MNAASKKRLAGAHPLLIKLFKAVDEKTSIMILDSQRGRTAQEKAFAMGHSRAHFGQSAHNWTPAIALDVVPSPLNWEDIKRFKALAVIVKAEAKRLGILIQWGGDWKTLVDLPHYELTPWRAFAAKSKPFTG